MYIRRRVTLTILYATIKKRMYETRALVLYTQRPSQCGGGDTHLDVANCDGDGKCSPEKWMDCKENRMFFSLKCLVIFRNVSLIFPL